MLKKLTIVVVAALAAATMMAAQGQEEPTTPQDWLERCDANDNGRVTCAEARAASCGAPIPVPREHPLYRWMNDRDGDGTVCE